MDRVPNVMEAPGPLLMRNVLSSLQYPKDGKLGALAFSMAKRAAAVADLPVMAITCGLRIEHVARLVRARRYTRAHHDKLSAEFSNVVKSPDVASRLSRNGAATVGSSPDVLRDFD